MSLTNFSLDYRNSLVADIAETWGNHLENLNYVDRFWLLWNISQYMHQEHHNLEPSDAAVEVVQRLPEEFNYGQTIAFLKALISPDL